MEQYLETMTKFLRASSKFGKLFESRTLVFCFSSDSSHWLQSAYFIVLLIEMNFQDNEKVKAAVTIQRFYRAYVARKVYSRLLAEELNKVTV